jgi:hypothetical protein
MALYNEILTGRFNRFLQKFLSMKGPPPSPQLAGDIQPSLTIESDVENFYLQGFNRFAQQVNLAGAVGFIGAIRLRNPTGSAVVAVLESLTVSVRAADGVANLLVQGGPATTDLPVIVASTTGQRLDARSIQNATLVISTDNSTLTPAPLQTERRQLNAGINTSAEMVLTDDVKWTILPGDGIEVMHTATNTVLRIAFQWRERSLEESERT